MWTVTSTKPRESHSSPGSDSADAGLKWKVLIVDPHAPIREMIRAILDGYADLIEVAGEASDAEGAVEQARSMAIDLVLIDTHLINGVDAITKIRQLVPQVVILGMSALYAPYLYNALMVAGAVAFVRLEDAADHLFRSIVFAMCSYGPMHRHVHSTQSAIRPNAASFAY